MTYSPSERTATVYTLEGTYTIQEIHKITLCTHIDDMVAESNSWFVVTFISTPLLPMRYTSRTDFLLLQVKSTYVLGPGHVVRHGGIHVLGHDAHPVDQALGPLAADAPRLRPSGVAPGLGAFPAEGFLKQTRKRAGKIRDQFFNALVEEFTTRLRFE